MAQYSTDGTDWRNIDLISKDDLLKLVDLAVSDRAEPFEYDKFEATLIPNPAQAIVYRQLVSRFEELIRNREAFVEESKSLFRDAFQKYQ